MLEPHSVGSAPDSDAKPALCDFLHRSSPCGLILNRMVQYSTDSLDAAFAALADGTRRGVLEQVGHAECTITELAERFDMTLTGMRKHVSVLEGAGLVITEKVGRVRFCRIGVRRLDEVTRWIDTYHQLWDARFSELDKVLEEMQRKETADGRTQQPRGLGHESHDSGTEV